MTFHQRKGPIFTAISLGSAVLHSLYSSKNWFTVALTASPSTKTKETKDENGSLSRRWTCVTTEGNQKNQSDNSTKIAMDNNDSKKNSAPYHHTILVRTGHNIVWEAFEEPQITYIGRNQANMTGRYLKEMHLPITRIVHSSCRAAAETVDEIAAYMPLVKRESTHLLRDGNPLIPDPLILPASCELNLGTIFADNSRSEAAFRKYIQPPPPPEKSSTKNPSYDIIVCHGNVIRYFLGRLLEMPPEMCQAIGLDNCSLTWITSHVDGRTTVKAIGRRGHLAGDKIK